MTSFDSFEAVIAAEGSDLGTTAWHRISPEHVAMFAEATNAHEWVHFDEDRARRESPFGTAVVQGYLTLSLATPFVTELLDVAGFPINYGLGRARFLNPVPVGERVRARGILTSAQWSGDALRTAVELTYELEGAEKPPCVAEILSQFLRDIPYSYR